MKQKDKELLLKDLCARLAYNPFYKVDDIRFPVKLIRVEVDTVDGILLDFDYKNEQGLPLQVYLSEVKPYLRPMSSMTEEEKNDLFQLMGRGTDVERIDFYISNHFDYRGLIEKGLALEAPEDMYKNI